MENVSTFTFLLFITAVTFVIYQLIKVFHFHKIFIVLVFGFMLLIGMLGYTHFFKDGYAMPPRFLFLIGPGIISILIVFVTQSGRDLIDRINLKQITLLQTVRLPVEIVLHQLFIAGLVPKLMTFEGVNFDIIIGISAFIVYVLYVNQWKYRNKLLLIWNYIGLIFLLNIMFVAITSSKTPLQLFAFDQPNIAVTYFPFVWLPAIIVPAALFSHLVSIRLLRNARLRIQSQTS
jgi:hypothetical protein